MIRSDSINWYHVLLCGAHDNKAHSLPLLIICLYFYFHHFAFSVLSLLVGHKKMSDDHIVLTWLSVCSNVQTICMVWSS